MASFLVSSVLITGGNRGLGLNLIKQMLNSSGVPKHIIATCRSLKAENAQEIRRLAEKHSNIHVLEFDMTDVSEPRLTELVKQVSDIVQESGLNLLINNAGMHVKPESFENVSPASMQKTFDVNTIAPTMLTQALRPLLKRAAEANGQSGEQTSAAVINISSVMGSIHNLNNANSLSYKVSKAALNAVTKTVGSDLAGDGITVVSLHPGWVKTDMGGPNAHLTVEESVSCIIKFAYSLKKSHNAQFFNYDGTTLPW
ncbi:uncharacterized protein LOC114526377 [Dendronephthya gigantea]|uniref:uncharacterized protein LOC114526377 n=1 Tax=Dendronephthya gigantea TaxID=151771 RepID=UPI00106CAC3B|nr:uncharacterized protein LOC114526377 [Dendronephthya gigantea]